MCAAYPWCAGALDTLLEAGPVEIVVVLGHEAERVCDALGPLDDRVRAVVNDRHAEGQMTSVRAGLSALTALASGVMIALADQPALVAEDLRRIVSAFVGRTRGSILVPTHGGVRGNPIVLERAQVDAILARGAKFGCRQLVRDHADLVETFEMSTDRVLRDVDRPEDYEALS